MDEHLTGQLANRRHAMRVLVLADSVLGLRQLFGAEWPLTVHACWCHLTACLRVPSLERGAPLPLAACGLALGWCIGHRSELLVPAVFLVICHLILGRR